MKEPIVFFDSECLFCTSSVQRLIKMDRDAVFKVAPRRGKTGAELIEPRLSDDVDSIVLLEPGGEISVYSRAVFRALWLLGGLYALVGWLYVLSPIFDPFYRLVAKNRHRLIRKKEEVCIVPAEEMKKRTLP